MLRFATVLVLCAITVAGCSKQSDNRTPVPRDTAKALLNQPAPSMELGDLDGRPFSLESRRGKVVLLDFWATWCPPCRISIPELKTLHRDYASKGAEVVSISMDDRPDKVKEFAQTNGMVHTQLFAGDSDVLRRFGVRGIPMFFSIDKEGRITKYWIGFNSSMASEWRAELDRLLAL